MTPIYEYECQACGEETEKIQKAADKPIRKCPSCGALKLRRKVSRSAFHLKGGGWYVTDYKNGSGKKKGAAESGSGDSEKKAETKTEAKAEAKPESKPEAPKAPKKD